MKEKLISLVEDYFDEKEKVNKRELIQEISGNLTERFLELVASGMTEAEAYERCQEYLGDIRTLANDQEKVTTVTSNPLSIFFVIGLTFTSLVIFFLNTLISLVVLVLSLVVFSIEFRRQSWLAKKQVEYPNAFRFLTAAHKYLLLIWGFVFTLITMETINVLFSNLDKLSIRILFQSEPIGLVLLLCLILYAIILIPLAMYHNRIVSKYEDITGEKTQKLRFPWLFQSRKKPASYLSFRRSAFATISFLTLLSMALTLFSKVYTYRLAINPVTEEIIGWQLVGARPLWQQLFAVRMNFGFWTMIIIGSLTVFTLITGIFIKRFRSDLILFAVNFAWFMSMLIYVFNFLFYTGINYEFDECVSYSFGGLLIVTTYIILKQTWKVLFYDSEE